jgi:hypothetical protein
MSFDYEMRQPLAVQMPRLSESPLQSLTVELSSLQLTNTPIRINGKWFRPIKPEEAVDFEVLWRKSKRD